MATIQEARALGQDIKTKADAAKAAVDSLIAYVDMFNLTISDQNPTSAYLEGNVGSVDAVIAAFIPDYNSILTQVEAATDALGTDIFSVSNPI